MQQVSSGALVRTLLSAVAIGSHLTNKLVPTKYARWPIEGSLPKVSPNLEYGLITYESGSYFSITPQVYNALHRHECDLWFDGR